MGQSRDVPRNTTTPVVPPVATVLLDHTVQDADSFILTSSKGKSTSATIAKAVKVDATHSQIEIPIQDVRDKGLTYTLKQKRAGKGGGVLQELFMKVQASRLLIDKQATRPMPEKQKQYFTLRTDPPKTSDKHLNAAFADYSALAGKHRQESENDRALAKDSKALSLAYDSAIAVMTRQCRFVEWRFYGGGSDYKKWSPFGLLSSRAGSWKEIKGERWIYVYRRDYRTGNAPRWVEELYLDAQGGIAAVPMDGLLDPQSGKAADKRPKPVALGETISFARRIQGVAYEYFFFATRIRLSGSAIDKLSRRVDEFAPPVNFEDSDMNVADFQQGKALVAVLDPMTIALELHDAYIVALDDFTGYSSIHDGQSKAEQDAVGQRQKKLLLAQLIDSLTSKKSDPANMLYYKLNDAHVPQKPKNRTLDFFLKEYEEQLQHRLNWRDYWSSFITRWLDSPAIHFLEEVYQQDLANAWPDYLSFYDSVHERLYESADGRAYIEKVLGQPHHWVHDYVLPKADTSGDKFQVFRKAGGSILGIYREYGVAYLHRRNLPEFLAVTKNLAAKLNSDFKTEFQTIPQALKKSRGEVRWAAVKAQRIIVTKAAELKRSHEFRERRAAQARITFSIAVEGINLYLAFKAIEEAYKSGTPAEKAWAWLNLAGSMVDFSASWVEWLAPTPSGAATAAARAAVRTVALIGFVSAVIDTILGAQATVQAFKQGDMGGMVGSAVVTVGSAALALLSLRAFISGAMGGPWGLIAMLVVAIGYAIKVMFAGDTPYQKLVGHCEWGIEYGEDEAQPDWAPKPFKDWKDNFDAQVIAALNLLCTIEMVRVAEDLTAVKVQADWFPQGANLNVVYVRADVPSTVIDDTFVFADKGPVSRNNNKLAITASNGTGYLVKPPNLPARKPQVHEIMDLNTAGKKWVSASALLTVEYGEYKFRFPQKDRVNL